MIDHPNKLYLKKFRDRYRFELKVDYLVASPPDVEKDLGLMIAHLPIWEKGVRFYYWFFESERDMETFKTTYKMSEPILYAKVNGPPDNWHDLQVYCDGKTLDSVIECNVTEGWAIVRNFAPLNHDDGGVRAGGYKDTRVEGKFEIKEPDDDHK